MRSAGATSSKPVATQQTGRRLRYLTLLAAIATLLLGAASWVAGGRLAAPHPALIGPPPAELGARAVRIAQPNGQTVAGWFIPGTRNDGAMLLLHGLRADRRQMLGRARFLHDAGYSLLLIDLQAHGETAGEHIGFGAPESRNVHAAMDWLRKQLPGQPIGIIGVSLGGAAAVLAGPTLAANALVLESVYSSIEQAVQNRLAIRLGPAGRLLAPLLLLQIEPRLGIPTANLQPLQAITTLQSPLLLIAGGDDQHTLLTESQALFDSAPSPKALWVVDGAAHQDLHRFSAKRYQQTVLAFLQRYLRAPGAAPGQAAQLFSQATAAS